MGVAIGLGCAEFPFSGAAAYWRWIDMCEAGGVDSIWQTDRIVSRQPFLESMVTMAALAGRTRRMKFGMNVVSLAFRDPVLLAKQCATIDVLSEGRLLAGRDLASVPITIWGAKENLDLLKRDRDDGVSRVVVSLDSAKGDKILPELDRWANLIRQLGS